MEQILGTAIDTAVDTLLDPAEQSRLAEVAHATNTLTIVLMLVVIAANIAAIVLLIVMHKQTKKPRNVSQRYKAYNTTVGTVVSVKKVAYYIKRYVKNDNLDTNTKTKEAPISGSEITPTTVEKHTGSEVVYKSPEQLATEQSEATEIRKFRYKVFYEFTVKDTGNLYSGECYIYDPSAVNPGDIIEVTYKPDDPMINFTDYSMPMGFLAD